MDLGLEPMFEGKTFSPQTELMFAVAANETTIIVKEGGLLPPAPNVATIGTDEDGETVFYAAKEGNALMTVTRGFEGAAREWPAGTAAARTFTHYDYMAIVGNIEKNKAVQRIQLLLC